MELDENLNENNIENCNNIIDFEPVINELINLDEQLNKNYNIDDLVKQLNVDQKRVFTEVINCVKGYIKEMDNSDDNLLKNNRLNPKSVLRKFVSGVGGTGKSFLINVIRLYIVKKFEK